MDGARATVGLMYAACLGFACLTLALSSRTPSTLAVFLADVVLVLLTGLVPSAGVGALERVLALFPINFANFSVLFSALESYPLGPAVLDLYDRLENGDSVERVNVVGMLEDGTLTVEHIMPQTLSPQWRHELGEEADDEVHAAYVNTIGNLTLTGYNSQYSNNPFADKRDRENGFRDSGLRLSRAVALCDRWGIREIEERRERLWSRFLKLWPMPESTYAPAEAARESRALDGGFEFTGLKVSACSLRGERAAVGTWVEAMRWLLPRVYAEDPRAFRAAVTGGRFPSRYFSTEPLGYGFEIGGGIWYNPGCSTSEKMETLRRIVDGVDTLEQGDISFEVRP